MCLTRDCVCESSLRVSSLVQQRSLSGAANPVRIVSRSCVITFVLARSRRSDRGQKDSSCIIAVGVIFRSELASTWQRMIVSLWKRATSTETPFFFTFSNTDTRAARWEICCDPNQVKKALSLDLPFVRDQRVCAPPTQICLSVLL